MKRVCIVLPGEPHAQKRPRTRVILAARPFAQVYDHPDSEEWKKGAASHIRAAMELPEGRMSPFAGPVRVRIFAVFSRLKKDKGTDRAWYVGVKDLDNVAKAVLDAASQADLWSDDRLVADLRVRGVLATAGEEPRTVLVVEEILEAPAVFAEAEG